MKKNLILLLLIFYSGIILAAPEKLSRYEIELTLTNEQNYRGYIYPAITMGADKYNSTKGDFKDYILKTTTTEIITLYTFIKSIKNDLNIDFSSPKYIQKIIKGHIKSITLINEYLYDAELINEITDKELEQIKNTSNLYLKKIYNSEYSEYCVIILLSAFYENELEKEKTKVEKDLNSALKIKVEGPDLSLEVNKYLKRVKKELKEKNIIFFHKCSPS